MSIRIISFPEGLITKPEKYLGKKSITLLDVFHAGCLATENRNIHLNCKSIFEMDLFDFERWVDNKQECSFIENKSEISSFKKAALIYNDEEKAFDLWINWYKEYKNISKEYFDKIWEENLNNNTTGFAQY